MQLKNIEYLTFGSHQLDSLTALHAKGDFDAVIELLQGQVTSDCKKVSIGQGQPSALCDEKGYILCNFDIVVHDSKVLVIIDAVFKDLFVKEINKVAPFYKVSIEVYQTKVIGLIRRSGEQKMVNEHEIIVSDDVMISLAFFNDEESEEAKMVNEESTGWSIGRKLLGDHIIGLENQGKYRPHELNQNIYRVSFSKGCFRGQEIIARMEYLGKQKKQTQLIIHSDLEEVNSFKLIGKRLKIDCQFFSSCFGANNLFK